MDTVQSNWADPGLCRPLRVHGRPRRRRCLPACARRLVGDPRGPAHLDVHDSRGAHVPIRRAARRPGDRRQLQRLPGAPATPAGRGRTRSSGPRSPTYRHPTRRRWSCTMSAPFTAFPETLATEYAMIQNPAKRAELGEEYGATEADGTGPFTLASFQPGTEVVVNRWDDYPGTNVPYITNPGPAYLDSVKWVPILEAGQRANEIEGGTVNVVKNPAGRTSSGSRATAISSRSASRACRTSSSASTPSRRSWASTTSASARRSRTRSTASPSPTRSSSARPWPRTGRSRRTSSGTSRGRAVQPVRSRDGCVAARRGGLDGGSDGIREKDGRSSRSRSRATTTTSRRRRRSIRRSCRCWRTVGIEMKLDVPDAAEYFGIVAAAAAPRKRSRSTRGASSGCGRRRSTCSSSSTHSRARPSTATCPTSPRPSRVADGSGRSDARGGRARVPARLGRAASRDPDPDQQRHLGPPEERHGLHAAPDDAVPALQRRLDIAS